MSLPLITLLHAFVLNGTAEAAPKREQVHVQLQTGVFDRTSVTSGDDGNDVEVVDTTIGIGEGGTGVAVGYMIKAPSEVGLRLGFAKTTTAVDTEGVEDTTLTHTRLAAYYTHYFRVEKPMRAYLTAMGGIDNTDNNGDTKYKSFGIGGAGGLHWFATNKASLNAGLEVFKSLSGKIEVDGTEDTTDFSSLSIGLVGGVNVYIGGPNDRKGRRGGRRR